MRLDSNQQSKFKNNLGSTTIEGTTENIVYPWVINQRINGI